MNIRVAKSTNGYGIWFHVASLPNSSTKELPSLLICEKTDYWFVVTHKRKGCAAELLFYPPLWFDLLTIPVNELHA